MPKIKYPENIQKLKEQLETGNNLIDYFFICGISPSLCTNELLYKITSEKSDSEIFKDILKPTILSKFPEFDKTNDTIDDGIIAYCFPDGFNIEYNDTSYPAPKIFSIILDNASYSQDYPQKYLTCALIYESLYKYKKLKQLIENLENNKENSGQKNDITNNINNMRNNLEEEKNMNIFRHKKMITSALPSMDLELIKMNKKEINDMNKDNNIIDLDNTKDNKKKPSNKIEYYYIPKCICLVSIHPNVRLFQKILSRICAYGLSPNNEIEIPLEKIITNLIIEVPVPPRGLYSIYYNYNFDFSSNNNNNNINTSDINTNDSSSKIDIKVPPLQSTENNKLLLSDIDLSKFNKNLSFNCKMEIIKHILLQTKILFFSLNLSNILDTISAIMSLIFPFKYPFQILSCLHSKNFGILESPSPFIIGIKDNFYEDFFEKNEITLEAQNFLVVDLDSKHEKNFYLYSDEDFPKFPSKLLSTLEKEIKSVENSKNKTMKEFNEIYQEKFFNFFCEILRGYEEFLNRNFFNEDFVDIKTLFNCDKFIKSIYHSQADYPFYTKFVEESQLFQEFILKNMIPKNNNELMDILFVNNYLNPQKKKKNNKLNEQEEQNDYKMTNKYIVPRPKELTKEEKDQIIKDNISLTKKGQIIKTTKAKEDTIIKFDYVLFPELDFNIYCNNDNVNQYFPPPDYREEIEALNMEAISKSSLGKNINKEMEMKNYLYLTWLEIWAFTFGNNDIRERHYRFDQMLDVLDKVIHHEMNILNLMFTMLNQFKEHDMMLKLYQKILQLKLKPSTLIFDIMKQIVDKKNMMIILDETKKNDKKLKSLKFNDYNKMNYRERTFLSINDNLPLETKPKFYFDYDCLKCNEKINLYLVSKNFDKVKNDTLWVPCSKCDEYNLPKITVKFGLDFINNQSKSTSIEEYVLHSPYNLKTNIKQAFNTQLRNENQNEKFKLKISNFKTQFKPHFWDFIWYCIIHDLDYNILLPYSKTLEEEKKAHFINPNLNIFEVCYDDSKYVDNQNKIERISSNIIKLNSEEKNKKKKFKNLKKCSGVIGVEIKDKINIILYNEIKEEKEEENNYSISNDSEDDKEKNKKENVETSSEKKSIEDVKIKPKKLSMFDFFFNVKDKIDKVKEEIKQEDKDKEKEKEDNKKEEKKNEINKKDEKKVENDEILLGDEYIDE